MNKKYLCFKFSPSSNVAPVYRTSCVFTLCSILFMNIIQNKKNKKIYPITYIVEIICDKQFRRWNIQDNY